MTTPAEGLAERIGDRARTLVVDAELLGVHPTGGRVRYVEVDGTDDLDAVATEALEELGPVTTQTLRPLVRPHLFFEALLDRHKHATLITGRLASDLTIAVVARFGRCVVFPTEAELDGLGRDPRALVQRACDNLIEAVEVRVDGPAEGPWTVHSGGGEADLLTLTSLWRERAQTVEGALHVVAPARDRVVYGGPEHAEALGAIGRERHAVRVSGSVLHWTGHRWKASGSKECSWCHRVWPVEAVMCDDCGESLEDPHQVSMLWRVAGAAAVVEALVHVGGLRSGGAFGWVADTVITGIVLALLAYPASKLWQRSKDPARPILREMSSGFGDRFSRLVVVGLLLAAVVALTLGWVPDIRGGVALVLGVPAALALFLHHGPAFFDPRVLNSAHRSN